MTGALSRTGENRIVSICNANPALSAAECLLGTAEDSVPGITDTHEQPQQQ